MKTLRRALLIVMLVGSAGVAHAACTDPAAPEVNWRRCYNNSQDLTGVDLTGAMLREATFQRSDLSGAMMAGIDGRRAKFLSTRMVGAILDGAKLIEADFTRADLAKSSLREADLRNAKLVDANLAGADLTGARLEGADFRNAVLDGAIWTDGKRTCAVGSVGRCRSSSATVPDAAAER